MGGMARTALLMFVLTGMLLLIGFAAGYLTGIPLTYTLGIFLLIAVLMNLAIYWYADRWVLKLYRAKIVSEAEQPKLHGMVSHLASNARLPKPKVAIIPIDTPNAFATGRSPSHSVVAVTQGAMDMLDDEELEAVLGHELAHIKNRDMLINTIAAIIGAVITYVMYFSIFAGGRRDRGGGGGILAILAIILIPFVAMLVRLSISRGREYGADRDGAGISRKPLALANALRKLQSAARSRPMQCGNPSTAHMFIVNPFSGVRLSGLFSTHPPAEERIKRLELMARTGRF
ncbi:MAG: zinc metalloprotease HtpX [Candidatus Hodarchaeaceae archaeon]|nr:zinc metalloprotease HtpX [Candidatus Hodarchaeaceae archaeon]